MTSDATSPLKDGMDCARVAQEDILEGYLLGKLSEEDRDAFEEHYFECAGCFDQLRTLQDLREELAHARTEPDLGARRVFQWAAVAAFGTAASISLALVVSLYHPPAAIGGREEIRAFPQSEPTGSPSRETDGRAKATFEQLAQVEPPPYQLATLRGPSDEATRRFAVGMVQYRKANYTNAVHDLVAAKRLDPNGADISFFLGVSELMLGHLDVAIDSLQDTIALGDSPYLEDAHFYLAKAFLRLSSRSGLRALGADGRGKVAARQGLSDGQAEAELNQVIRLGGPRSEEAQRLLTEIDRLKQQ